MFTRQHEEFFDQNGFVVVSGSFSEAETARLREHFTYSRESGTFPDDMEADTRLSHAPLQKYPRMIHMHR